MEETLPEDIPDELGHEWRVLHPFDLPGVRNPIDAISSNQRRLAENDALVELIQMEEYLDDVPTWDCRDYRLYPPHYGDPFYRGRCRGRGRGGRGRREGLQERCMDRPNEGFGRGNNQSNNIRVQQPAPTERSQPVRQDDGWSSPTNIERREDREGHQTPQVPPSEVPPPAKERLFTNWSSENSPRERVAQCVQSARSIESHSTMTQTEQNVREPDDNEVLRYVLRDVTYTPSDRIQISQVGARLIDTETNTSEVETILPRKEVRTDNIHTYSKGIQVPSSNSESSSHEINITEGPSVRSCIPDTMPQLERSLSICTRRKRTVPEMRRYTIMPGGSYPDYSESDSHDNRSCEGRRYPRRRRHYQDRGGRPPDREDNYNRGGAPNRGGLPNGGGPPDDRRPPNRGGPHYDGGPPDD